MKVLFIGGTGIISTACTRLALARGHDVTLVNRGRHGAIDGAKSIVVDINDVAAARGALAGAAWDAVVDFVSFTPADIEKRLEVFSGNTGQYVFISSASAYQKPVDHYVITESTPLVNPFWDYSRAKAACEDRLQRALRDNGFPATLVRPSLTYGETMVPLPMNSWALPYTAVDRLRRGVPVIIPGDGTSLWTITHNTDFAKGLVGLLGLPAAKGEAFHITSDEVLSWNQIYQAVADAAGVSAPKFLHIASDYIAACLPEKLGSLHGDKIHSAVFDNTKIKRFVPGFSAPMPFAAGIRRSIAWFDADPARRQLDAEANAKWDQLIAAYERGLAASRKVFGLP